jgi:hypothetical protein
MGGVKTRWHAVAVEENAALYMQAPQQKPGCGFPLMPLLGLFDLHGGTWVAAVKSKGRAHDALLAWRMLRHLRSGDILIADRAFGSYAFIAACKARGVDVVMRLHQARDPQVEKGKRVGDNDWHVTWQPDPVSPTKEEPECTSLLLMGWHGQCHLLACDSLPLMFGVFLLFNNFHIED